MTGGQLVMPSLFDAYWVESMGHGIIPDGTRFLIVEEWLDGGSSAGGTGRSRGTWGRC